MVNNSSNINKVNYRLSPKESLNSDGQQFHQYQQSEQSMNNQNNHCQEIGKPYNLNVFGGQVNQCGRIRIAKIPMSELS
jgi:hypothetical protein